MRTAFALVFLINAHLNVSAHCYHVLLDLDHFAISGVCMRLEGKNAHIKQLVGKNFKNLPKSVAHRHQRYMCLQLPTPLGVKCTNFLYSGDEIKQGMYRFIYVTVSGKTRHVAKSMNF